ncbi:hypothetical protein HAX54_017845 [Datura stramonium]|uniref:Uncharacterized protein n=1 Tax=Datura stramonium TaxID=4076 RepID=A0ABS8UNL1_DATST|nr:hypothetical protein [Datura stramonium]
MAIVGDDGDVVGVGRWLTIQISCWDQNNQGIKWKLIIAKPLEIFDERERGDGVCFAGFAGADRSCREGDRRLWEWWGFSEIEREDKRKMGVQLMLVQYD